VSSFVGPLTVSAQTPAPATPAPATPAAGASTAAPTADTAAPSGNTITGNPVVESGFNILNPTTWIPEAIKQVAIFFLTLSAVFLGLVGLLFNWTIYITVFQFGNLIGNNPGMLAAWGVLRDIGNIVLLFGFIFMGVSTILNLPGNEFTAKRALPSLIIFAVLLNFSLFAAEAVIDVSNGLASTFYNQAGAGLCAANQNIYDCATNNGIGGAVLQMSGIVHIFDFTPQSAFSGNSIGTSIAIVGLTLFAATTAMVLLAAVFMFIARACTLAFLMAVSPIGFAGMAIPFLHKFAQMWWDQILKQAFFAPIYILLILISLKFMDGVRIALLPEGSDTQTLAQVFTQSGVSNLSMVVLFILLIGFMLMATQAAKSMSAVGAGSSTKWAGAMVFGGMARASNGVWGGGMRLGRMASRNVASNANRNTWLGRLQYGVANTATSTFRAGESVNTDLRRIPGAGGAISRFAGPASDNATFTAMGHQLHEVGEGMRKGQQASRDEASRVMLQRELRNTPAGQPLSQESERFLAGLSAEQIAADHALMEAIEGAADRLSSDQFEGLMKNDKVSQQIKAEMAQHRFGEQIAMSGQAYSNENRDAVRRMTKKDLAMFAKYRGEDFNRLMQVTNDTGDTLTNNSQNESLEDNDSLTRSQRDIVRGNTRRGKVGRLYTAATGGAAYRDPVTGQDLTVAQARERMLAYASGLGSKEKNKMAGGMFTDNNEVSEDLASTLTSEDLREFQREKKYEAMADRQTIQSRALRGNNFDEVEGYLRRDPRVGQYWNYVDPRPDRA
jgi:hypothetical protein